jgi:hypothetical protein
MKRSTYRIDDSGLRLTSSGRRILIAVIIALLLIAVAFALTDTAGATTMDGNKGGCGRGNMWYGLACTVTDSGQGYVSGTCKFGLWFSRVATARAFRLDQSVKVNGCEGLGGELYAPIRISR